MSCNWDTSLDMVMHWFTPELAATLDICPPTTYVIQEEPEFQRPPLPYNPFDHIPVEIIRHIGEISEDPDAVAALALSNHDLESILEGSSDPGATAYAAICSLERNLVQRTLRKRGGHAIRTGLTRYVNDVYALDVIAQHNRRDLLSIVEPYITYGDPGTHAAVITAVERGHHNLVRRLMPHLSDDSIIQAFGETCTAGDSSVVNSLIYHVPTRLWRKVCSLNLESAVTSARIELVRVLIAAGADLDTIMVSEQDESDQSTCLHWLAIYGLGTNEIHHSVGPLVRMFCEDGANVNALDSKGRSSLHYFALGGSRAVGLFEQFPDDFTNQRLGLVYEVALKDIIKAGAKIDQQDEFGKTPLHLAVENRESVMIKVLMEAGVNALIRDHEGIRASRANETAHITPHTIEYQVLMLEMKQEMLAKIQESAVL
ncbi:uncharacterized protein H6S33_008110 [Morchella sextelata]|uniref:uncharacterized protein n=1 Tax=Morchella sextelata TaxID=1174677 RepID=UPI001D035EB4|nr:uncharacterized protein H6S33_008110 [Morchella sextelata]KAH0603106.1 hypothetical protein H6S33_008110 [Morchella sextelata]